MQREVAETSAAANETRLDGEAAVDKIRELLPRFRAAMLVSGSGETHVRPMGLLGDVKEFDGRLWFFLDARSRKARDVEGDAAVSVVCQDDGRHTYLCLCGVARVARDEEKMRELYTPLVKVWFPDGLEDPNLTLMTVHVDEGTFWETPGGAFTLLAAFAKSLTTGQPAEGGLHGEIVL